MGLISGSLIRELRSHRLYGSAKNASKTKKNIAYTAVFKMDNQQVLLYSTENSAQCHVAAWMGGEFRGEWIHLYMYIHVYVYVCMYVCICMYICMYMYIHVYTYIHMYVYMYICMYMYMYIHVYMYG